MGFIKKATGEFYLGSLQDGDIVAPTDPLIPDSRWDFTNQAWIPPSPGTGYIWDSVDWVWVPPLSVEDFKVAIYSNSAIPDSMLTALFGDSQGRGTFLLIALELSVKTGDYTRVKRIFADMVTNPPVGMTSTDMQTIGKYAIAARFPLA